MPAGNFTSAMSRAPSKPPSTTPAGAVSSVPHDWSAELPFNKSSPAGGGGGFLDGGVGWYRKTFTLDSSYSGQKIRIEFDGVYMNSQVWINGTSLGTRPYGYSTFEYDLTPYVKLGASNVIAVRVDNSSQPNSRWYSGSGIYRNVWLTVLNPVHVAYNGAFITTPSVSATSASVSIAADVENQSSDSQSVTITAEVRDASGAVVASTTTAASSVAAGTTSTLHQSLTVSTPHLWSTDAPYLYQAKISVQAGTSTVDTYLVPLGLRSYSFDPSKGFSLNGQSMKLWGTANHHDFGAIGTAYHRRALERQLQILKGMGVNALRTVPQPARSRVAGSRRSDGVPRHGRSFRRLGDRKEWLERLPPVLQAVGSDRHSGLRPP